MNQAITQAEAIDVLTQEEQAHTLELAQQYVEILPLLKEIAEASDITNDAVNLIYNLATDVCMGMENIHVDWQEVCADTWGEDALGRLNKAANNTAKIAAIMGAK